MVPLEFEYSETIYDFDEDVPGILLPKGITNQYKISSSRNMTYDLYTTLDPVTGEALDYNTELRNYNLNKHTTYRKDKNCYINSYETFEHPTVAEHTANWFKDNVYEGL